MKNIMKNIEHLYDDIGEEETKILYEGLKAIKKMKSLLRPDEFDVAEKLLLIRGMQEILEELM